MAEIKNIITVDEKTFQIRFYEAVYGDDYITIVTIDRSTDGYTDGVLFEHKQNLIAYGRAKALSQALIYLARFNVDGMPVRGKIGLPDHEGKKMYVYDANDYADIINDTQKYAKMKASTGIEGFVERKEPEVIPFDINSAAGMRAVYEELTKPATYVKVNIDKHNVYGWANYYYQHAAQHGQKPRKKAFFEELKNPCGTLREFINPWTGTESDFTFIMDLLNDPMTQKKLGAYYTPTAYCVLAAEELRRIIKSLPEGVDYVIVDPAAGTGNLEAVLTDEELSHVIVNTYEIKESIVLEDRIGSRVRYNMSKNEENPDELPAYDEEGFIIGCNALSKEFAERLEEVIEKTKKAEKIVKIWYMNPPYVETTGVEFQKKKEGKKQSDWKKSYVVEEMKKSETVKGAVSNDMANAFIWPAFNIFDADYCVVFSPIKYWKAQNLIGKKFLGGYAVNRQHFHAQTAAAIMLASWSKEEDPDCEEITLKALDLDENENYVDCGEINVKKIHSLFSEAYYDSRKFETETEAEAEAEEEEKDGEKEDGKNIVLVEDEEDADKMDGILCELNGKEYQKSQKKAMRAMAVYNKNAIGYIVAKSSGFDNPRLSSCLLRAAKYDANGFILREDNFLEKLPLFAASRYTDHVNDWTIMSMIMKSGDKKKEFKKDVAEGKLNDFLCKCLIWTCFTHYGHMRSLNGSDGRLYLNELCFDGDTLAARTLQEFKDAGYVLTKEEEELFTDWDAIMNRVSQKFSDGNYRYPYNKETGEGYNPDFKYGLYQIDEEVNYKIESSPDKNGKTRMVFADGDLNNMIKAFKKKVRTYYINNLVDVLYEYEFLK